MSRDDQDTSFFNLLTFPVGRVLKEIRPSPRASLFQAWRPSQKNRRAARIGSGTRRAQALLKRLDVTVQTKPKTRF